jgi:hypothetical protein
MRLWSGTQVGFGQDHFGPSVIVAGNRELTVLAPVNNWKLDQEKTDGTRIWRPVSATVLERIQVPCPDLYSDTLRNVLSGINTTDIHPAIINGLDTDALRLFPALDATAVELFSHFVNYLRTNFKLDENAMRTAATESYIDGFGPELLVKLNGQTVVLPEMPPAWLAPANWSYATWRVTNGMTGPYTIDTDETMAIEERLGFLGDFPAMDLQTEGLVYYHAARAMVAWAAWENDANARFVQAIASIITSGYRPLKPV